MRGVDFATLGLLALAWLGVVAILAVTSERQQQVGLLAVWALMAVGTVYGAIVVLLP